MVGRLFPMDGPAPETLGTPLRRSATAHSHTSDHPVDEKADGHGRGERAHNGDDHEYDITIYHIALCEAVYKVFPFLLSCQGQKARLFPSLEVRGAGSWLGIELPPERLGIGDGQLAGEIAAHECLGLPSAFPAGQQGDG